MKRLLLLAFIALSVFGQTTPQTVYILPMAGGLDQYLAQSITRERVLQVVADPKIADLVLTDQLGVALEQKLAEIHPKDDKKTDTAVHNEFRSSRGKGTVFLVDTRSRQVLWSDYEEAPGSNSNSNLNRQAERIAKKLPPLKK
jgi:hypothetical protein